MRAPYEKKREPSDVFLRLGCRILHRHMMACWCMRCALLRSVAITPNNAVNADHFFRCCQFFLFTPNWVQFMEFCHFLLLLFF